MSGGRWLLRFRQAHGQLRVEEEARDPVGRMIRFVLQPVCQQLLIPGQGRYGSRVVQALESFPEGFYQPRRIDIFVAFLGRQLRQRLGERLEILQGFG